MKAFKLYIEVEVGNAYKVWVWSKQYIINITHVSSMVRVESSVNTATIPLQLGERLEFATVLPFLTRIPLPNCSTLQLIAVAPLLRHIPLSYGPSA
jgi:hypothetical protein